MNPVDFVKIFHCLFRPFLSYHLSYKLPEEVKKVVVEREEWRAYSGDGVTDRVLARRSLRQLIFHTHTAALCSALL